MERDQNKMQFELNASSLGFLFNRLKQASGFFPSNAAQIVEAG